MKLFKRKKNKAIPIIIATDSLVMFASAMLAPIFALFVDKIGGTLLDASMTVGAFALAAGFTSLLSGKYTDKIKEKEYIVIAGYLIIGIGFLLMFFAESVAMLVFIQLLIGFGQALYSPAFDALFTQHANRKKMGRQWGAWESMYYFTTAAGAFLGGLIVTIFSFSAMFVIMALLCFGSAVYILFLPRKLL